MNKNKGFDEENFIKYLRKNYYTNDYSIDLIINIIKYGQENCHVSKGQFVNFLLEILPEIEIEQIVEFCDDEILTEDMKSLKKHNKIKKGIKN